MRGPWIASSNQSILKEINPEYSSGLMLKLQYWPPDADSLEKDPDAGKDRGQKGVRMTWLDGRHLDLMNVSTSFRRW